MLIGLQQGRVESDNPSGTTIISFPKFTVGFVLLSLSFFL